MGRCCASGSTSAGRSRTRASSTRGGRLVATGTVPTTPGDPSLAVVEGPRSVLAGLDAEAVEQVVHATTLITNAIVERRGARVGLLVTRGYADALEIARQHRYDMYD